MKKFILCLCLGLLCLASNAQVMNPVVKKPYKELRTQYDPHQYVATFSDKYSPTWCAIGSVFIPGLGNAICGEWGRAAIQFVGCEILVLAAKEYARLSWVYEDYQAYSMRSLACYMGALTMNIWSIVDVVKVAKVKNMYYQSAMMSSSIDVKLSPSFACLNTGEGVKPTAGFAMNISF